MIQPEPIHFFTAARVFGDVKAQLTIWQQRLDNRRSAAVAAFADQLATMQVPDGISYADFAEAQADIAIDRWCQQRDTFSREIVSMFEPESVAIAQHLGVAAGLGQHVGLHLDNALMALDRELRSVCNSAEPR